MSTTSAAVVTRNTATVPGPLTLLLEGLRDMFSRGRLVRYLVQADMKKRGVDTLLGNLWWVMDPLLLMVVYVIFVTLLGRGRTTPDFPLFVFAAVLPWKWFTSAVQDGTVSIYSQSQLIKQIAFPKIVLPLAATTAGVVGFFFGLIPLGAMMLFYPTRISAYLLLIPVIAIVQYVFTLAVATLVATGNVFFRDLGNVVQHLLRLWFYLSPGLYSLSYLDDVNFVNEHPWVRVVANMNPFAVLFDSYRRVIYGTDAVASRTPGLPPLVPAGPPTSPDWVNLGLLLLVSCALVCLATVVFKRVEPEFAKVL